MSNFIRYIIQEDPEKEITKTQERTFLSKQNYDSKNLLENNRCFPPQNKQQSSIPWSEKHRKKVYSTPSLKRYSNREIINDTLEGFAQGVLGGVERAVNAGSGGLYSILGDGGYQKRQQKLEEVAKQEHLEKAYNFSNFIVDKAAGNLPLSKGFKKISKPISMLRKITK